MGRVEDEAMVECEEVGEVEKEGKGKSPKGKMEGSPSFFP